VVLDAAVGGRPRDDAMMVGGRPRDDAWAGSGGGGGDGGGGVLHGQPAAVAGESPQPHGGGAGAAMPLLERLASPRGYHPRPQPQPQPPPPPPPPPTTTTTLAGVAPPNTTAVVDQVDSEIARVVAEMSVEDLLVCCNAELGAAAAGMDETAMRHALLAHFCPLAPPSHAHASPHAQDAVLPPGAASPASSVAPPPLPPLPENYRPGTAQQGTPRAGQRATAVAERAGGGGRRPPPRSTSAHTSAWVQRTSSILGHAPVWGQGGAHTLSSVSSASSITSPNSAAGPRSGYAAAATAGFRAGSARCVLAGSRAQGKPTCVPQAPPLPPVATQQRAHGPGRPSQR
jgi:hypothetical protein